MQKYSHSGIVPVSGAIATVIVGLLVAAVGGAIYAFAAYWLSIGFLRLMLMLGYSFAVGLAISAAANRGKIRSPLFNTVIALLAVAIGMWIYWGSYDVARNGARVAAVAWMPHRLHQHGQDLFDKGSWTMKGGRKVNGWPLVAFWVAEGLAVTITVAGLARSEASRPFCESCQEWTDTTSGLMRFAADGQEPAWQEVLSGDLPALAEFAPTGVDTTPHVRLDLAHCPKCQHSNFVTLTTITITTDSKGKTKTAESTLVTNGAISDPEAEFLRQFANQQHASVGEADDDDDDDDDDVEQRADEDDSIDRRNQL